MDAERRDEWKRVDGDAEVERDLEVAEMFRTMTRDHQAQRRALLSWDVQRGEHEVVLST